MRSFLSPVLWWPGLAALWREGSPGGLGLAMLFAGLVNAALLATLVWPGAVGVWVKGGLWLAVVFVWGGAIVAEIGARRDGKRAGDGNPPGGVGEDLFLAACGEYLRGHWEPAEHLIRRILRANGQDVEARLLWATLLRHTGRTREARRQLRRAGRLEAAERWAWEIQREWQLLESREGQLEQGPAGLAASLARRAA